MGYCTEAHKAFKPRSLSLFPPKRRLTPLSVLVTDTFALLGRRSRRGSAAAGFARDCLPALKRRLLRLLLHPGS
jgi:hypothetical protein